MNIPARAKADTPYEHRFHAGNVGDVLKHLVLMTVLDHTDGPRTYVETHAGAGRYRLPPVGEWTEGIGRLLASDDARPAVVERYLSLARREDKALVVPGSPLVARALLGDKDRAHVIERAPDVMRTLSGALAGDARFVVVLDDGVRVLASGLEEVARTGRVVVLVDPPWVEKSEWQRVPRALVDAHQKIEGLVSLLWYPVKSHTRPNAMIALLEEQGLPGVAIELVTAPLAVKKNRLAGSGVVLTGVSPRALEPLSALLGYLGPRLAHREGFFSSRIVSWGARAREPGGAHASSG